MHDAQKKSQLYAKSPDLIVWLMPLFCTVTGLLALRYGFIPYGVSGEWEWQKPNTRMTMNEWIWAVLTVAFYLAAISLLKLFVQKNSFWQRACLILMFPIAAIVQVGLQMAAPSTFGMAKWAMCTFYPASSGYYAVAANEVNHLPEFLENYSDWIKKQDALHIGTHPPGLIIEAKMWIEFWERRPDASKELLNNLIGELRGAVRMLIPGKKFPEHQLAAIVSISITHWLFCASAVFPIWAMIRRLDFSPLTAFQIAAIWPVVPSAVMFQPASDIAFPVIAVTAFALSIEPLYNRLNYKRLAFESLACGFLLAFGMFLSLVFLPVGLIIAMLLLFSSELSWGQKLGRIIFVGVGFIAGTCLWAYLTNANPLKIWYYNKINHGRFYVEYPRSYLKWVLADIVEISFGFGLSLTCLLVLGTIMIIVRKQLTRKTFHLFIFTSLVLSLLVLSGKNLSEVSRLWLPFIPVLFVPVAYVIERFSKYRMLGVSVIVLLMIQIVFLQSIIQVVYSF